MPDVNVALAAGPGAGQHPHVVITGAGRSVVLDRIDAAAEFDNLAASWEEVERPTRKPWRLRKGPQLGSVSTSWRIGNDDRRTDVGPRLAALTYIGQNAERVIVGHTTPTGAPFSSSWTIDTLRFRVRQRRHGDNAITMVDGDLTLVEASSPYDSGVLPTAAVLQAEGLASSPTRRHTVSAGESLWAIATRYYGDIAASTRIAEANGLRFMYPLTVGSVLVLP